jgi:hypothetical protein
MANPNWKIRRTTTLGTLAFCASTVVYALARNDVAMVTALLDGYQLIVPAALAVYTGGVIVDDNNKRKNGAIEGEAGAWSE